jgi:hypothetical protein
MGAIFWQSTRAVTACLLAALFLFPPQSLAAETHGVSPSQFEKATVSASALRQHNLEQVNQFFATSRAQKALTDAHIDGAQVKKAISTLSDEELAKIARRTQKVEKDFAAGDLGSGTLTLMVIAIAAVLIIVVLVTKL